MNSNIDEFMIMSNDKDMTPLLTNVDAIKERCPSLLLETITITQSVALLTNRFLMMTS